MVDSKLLPIGQKARQDFPRFGVTTFAKYQAPITDDYTLLIAGDVASFSINKADLEQLPRVEQISDFHCVTTWSYCNLRWLGFRFRDVHQHLIQPQLTSDVELVAFRAHDKFKSSLLLQDALAKDVLLVDTLDGEPLSGKHGAPLRLIAPAHYGYKSVKHLRKIEVWQHAESYRPLNPRFMQHPRARVAHEERGRYLPGWFYRYLYRPLIAPTVRRMNANHRAD